MCLQVSESDTLPLQLCYNCTNILIEWDAAVLGSTAAEKKLRAIQWQEQLLNLNPEVINFEVIIWIETIITPQGH